MTSKRTSQSNHQESRYFANDSAMPKSVTEANLSHNNAQTQTNASLVTLETNKKTSLAPEESDPSSSNNSFIHDSHQKEATSSAATRKNASGIEAEREYSNAELSQNELVAQKNPALSKERLKSFNMYCEGLKFSEQDYDKSIIDLPLHEIKSPTHYWRDVPPSELASWTQFFQDRNYDPSIGTISVTKISDSGQGEYHIMDGRRRFFALCNLQKENGEKKYSTIPVLLWSRRDGRPCSTIEQLSISQKCNERNVKCTHPTFRDYVQASVSTVLATCNDLNLEPKDLCILQVSRLLKLTCVLGEKSNETCRVSAFIATKFAQHRVCFELFMSASETGKLFLLQINSRPLFLLDELGFDLAMGILILRFDRKVKGNFLIVRDSIYIQLREMLRMIGKTASQQKISLADVLTAKVGEKNGKPETLLHWMEDVLVYTKPPRGMGQSSTKDVRNVLAGIADENYKILREKLSLAYPSLEIDNERDLESNKASISRKDIESVKELQEYVNGAQQSINVEVDSGKVVEKEHLDTPRNSDPSKDRKLKEEGSRKKRSVAYEKKYKETTVRSSTWKKRKTRDDASQRQSPKNIDVMKSTILSMNQRELEELFDSSKVRIFTLGGNEASDKMEEFDESHSSFNDDLPFNLKGNSTPKLKCQERSHVTCSLYATELPSKWNMGFGRKYACSEFISALFVPKTHRVYDFSIGGEWLRHNHHAVFWIAAFNQYKKCNRFPPDRHNAFDNLSTDQKCWWMAIERDDAAKEYFSSASRDISTLGYHIFVNGLGDHMIPSKIAGVKIPRLGMNGKIWRELDSYVRMQVPKEEPDASGSLSEMWNFIVNEGAKKDAESSRRGVGRYISTNKFVTSYLEEKEDGRYAKYRCLLDLRIAQVVSAMKLEECEEGSSAMCIPKTGGRWLYTTEGCKAQQLHTDFSVLTEHQRLHKENPGFFAIATGEESSALWVCPNSHNMIPHFWDDPLSLNMLSKLSHLDLIRIPPYSIFVGRGDMFHAGCGFEENGETGGLRYHLYFVPKSSSLPDGIHLLHNFRPVPRLR